MRSRPKTRWTGLLVAALALGEPAAALAGPPPQDDAVAEAAKLYEEGQDRFDTADYKGAIELWTKAYGALPDTPQSATMRPLILYNIATAHEKSYEIFHDVAQLRIARKLLQDFERAIDAIFTDPADAQAERDRVRERIARIEARIADHVGTEPTGPAGPTEPTEPGPTPTEPDPTSDDGQTETQPPAELEPEDPRPRRKVDPKLVSGAVLIGLGVGATGVLASGLLLGDRANDISQLDPTDLAAREQQFGRGVMGNRLALVGAIAAPVLIGVGVTLVVLAKRKDRGSSARASFDGFTLRF